MLKLFQKKNGAVTVFLTLIMVPMLLVAEFAMDASRIYGAKTIVSGAGDLAMNAALTEYDKVLQDMYGLFATSSNEEELKENLGKYFKQTLEGIEPAADDDYTRVVLEQIKTLLRGDPEGDLQIHNLINLSSLGVEESSFVEGSELYYNETIKRQIVDYMKYRGPVSIGSNLLEKIGMITDVKKQQKVIEKKAAYDESLNGIQEALIALNQVLASYVIMSFENSREDNDNIPQFYKDGYGDLLDVMDPLMVAAMCNDGLSVPATTDVLIVSLESLQETVNSIDSAVGEARDIGSNIYSGLSSYLQYLYAIKTNYNRMNGVITNYPDLEPIEVEEPEEKTEEELAEMTPEQVAQYVAEYTAKLEKYNKYLEDKSLYLSLASAPGRMQDYMNDLINFRTTADEDFFDISKRESLAYWISRLESNRRTLTDQKIKYDGVCLMQEMAEAVITALDVLLEGIDAADEAAGEWEGSIDELGESALKESMGQQFKEVAKDLDKEKITALKSKMTTNLTYFTILRECIESVKYFEVQLFQKNVGLIDVYKQVARNNSIWSFTGTDAAHAILMVPSAPIGFLCNEGDFSKLSTVAGEVTVADDDFYKYLQEFCKKLPPELLEDAGGAESGEPEESEEQKKAKSEKTNIINNVNQLKQESENMDDSDVQMPTVEDNTYFADMATTLLLLTGADSGKSIPNVEDNDDAEEQSKKAGDGLSSFDFDTLANKLVEAAESFRDDIYVTEYMTEMFSCYTTGKNPNGGDPITVTNLSGYPIDKEHNYLFGCEQEYILWGQCGDDTSKNITYTVASIFAIRYVLNLAYAFTSPDIQAFTLSLATAIAGWTVFGVPLVQTVLILAIALGETAWDINDLKAGKDVVIYKSISTWRLSPAGLTQEVLETVIDEAKSAAIDKANEIIGQTCTKIENIIDEAVITAKSEADAAVNNIEAAFKGYSDIAVDTLVDQVVTWLVTPVTSSMQMYLLSLEEAGETAEKSISKVLDDIYNQLSEEVNKENNGLVKEIKKQALTYFKDNVLEEIKTSFISARDSLNGATAETVKVITKDINDQITEIRNSLKTEIKKMTLESPTYKKIKDECMQEFSDCLNFDWVKEEVGEAKNVASEKVSAAINSFADKMSYSVGVASESTGDGVKVSASKTEKGALFTLNYQEYVKIFILLGVFGNDRKQVARMCDLIKMNLCASEKAPNKDFMWSKSYTMFNMRAKAAVKTTIDYETKEQHTPSRFVINYNSYLGY